MAKVNYTQAQRRAVYYPDGDLLLSAAAGSGKTAALTGRIVQLIIEGRAELSEMLIVTFTKAAAGEMRGRITKLLREKMEIEGKENAQIMSRLSSALTQISSAQISTIHSFLYSTLTPLFPKIGLSQDTRIADPKEIDDLKASVMRDIVDEFFKKEANTADNSANIEFLKLADVIGQARDTDALDSEILWLSKKLDNCGADHNLLLKFASELKNIADERTEILETELGKMVIEDIRNYQKHYSEIFHEIEFEFESEPIICEKYGPALRSIIDWLDGLGGILCEENISYDLLKNHFELYKPEKLGRLSKKDSGEIADIFKIFRDEIKKENGNYLKYYFAADKEEFYLSANSTSQILAIAGAVLEKYESELNKKKNSMSIIEYGDLERYATELFIDKNGNPTEEANDIGRKFKYIFVDEYQDTNRIQDNIFRAIGKNSVRFMVGDIKQSIYRFRGADPSVFTEYREIWDKDETEEYTEKRINIGKSIFMSENFRCSREIIKFINAVSASILPYGGIPYEKEDELIFAKAEEGAKVPVEVVLIEKANSDDEDEDEKSESNHEAVYVARRIKSMIGRYSEDGSKIIEPSDIAILLRSPSSNGAEYRKELERMGVKAATKTVKSLNKYKSVLLLVSLIKFIDNPLRDVFAAGAMISPIFGFTVEDVIELRNFSGDLPLYTGVIEVSQNEFCEVDELHTKCVKLTKFIDEERLLRNSVSPEKYIENLIEKTEIYQIKEIKNNAPETDAIRRILALAKEFESKNKAINGNRNLCGFIEYLDEFLDEGIEVDNESQSDAVSIMSIHASKGLEFPVCFLSETAKKRNKADETRTVLFDDKLGFGMFLPDSTGLIRCDNLIRRTISKKIANDSIEEEMRMLYVALTRARGKLIVTAKTKSAEEALANAQLKAEFSDGYSVKKANSYIDWILGGIIKNKHSEDWRILSVEAENVESTEIFEEEAEPVEIENTQILEIAEEIKKRFDFKYKYDFLEKIPSKLVVSRLSPEILDDESEAEIKSIQLTFDDQPKDFVSFDEDVNLKKTLKRPSFMLEKKNVAANEIGNATHRFLQFVDYRLLHKNGLEAEMHRLRENKFISENDAEIINIRELRRFMQSSLFEALTRSDFVKREFRFNVLMNAEEFTENDILKEELHENNVKITVQGVVDCVFRDPDSGKLVLIDYKTDSILPDEWKNQKKAESRLRERHKNQLLYYQRICSAMFEENIEKMYIYSTPLGRCIEI